MQMPNGIRLFNLKLTEKPDGTRRAFAPSAFGSAVATFTPETAIEMVSAASAAFGEIDRNADPHS